MAAGRPDAPEFSIRKAFLWSEIFRTFQVAIHPRKLVIAGVGVLVMSLGWFLLSHVFYGSPPDRKDESRYGSKVIQERLGDKKPDGTEYTAADIERETERLYQKDLAQWRLLDQMAGPNGRLRTLPWYEYRGPNPYYLLTTIAGGNAAEIYDVVLRFLVGTTPVLIEPLVKLILPVVKIVDPNASPLTRLYLILCLVWGIAVWAFFGGVITRIAAIEFTGKDRVDTKACVKFVADRYVHYILTPLAPLVIIGVVVLVLMVFGFVALLPILGDVLLYGLGLPLVILGGTIIALLLIGLASYPLMYATISTEGSDTFDGFSRSYSYIYQAPWNYLWYSLVSIFYGALVTLFVIFLGSLAVYASKWAVSQAPLSESTNREPDYLFIYAPESFGWRQLMLKGGPLDQTMTFEVDPQAGRPIPKYDYTNPAVAQEYRKSLLISERIGAGLASFWLVALFMLMVGFTYSYFWSASTMIYLLMRKKVDEIPMDELFVEPVLPPASPVTPPAAAPAQAPAPAVAQAPAVAPTVAPAPTLPPVPLAPTTPATPAATEPTPTSPSLSGTPSTTSTTAPTPVTPPSPPATPNDPPQAD